MQSTGTIVVTTTGIAVVAEKKLFDEINGNSYHGGERHRELVLLSKLPCLRISGICPEKHPHIFQLATDKQETDDIKSLYALTANHAKAITDPQGIHGAHIVDDTGTHRPCVYTDGSCLMPRHQYLTHAGWGVAYGNKDCNLNESGPLASPVQTSYRAELRGVAQAIARVLPHGDLRGLQVTGHTSQQFHNDSFKRSYKVNGTLGFHI